jgi:hypothetical protein
MIRYNRPSSMNVPIRRIITMMMVVFVVITSMLSVVVVNTFTITTTTIPTKTYHYPIISQRIPITKKMTTSSTLITTSSTTTNTHLFSTTVPNDINNNLNKMESYGEKSRIYRRDVFNYDLWVEHRSTDRFVGNLFDILKSGIFRQLLPYCFFMSGIAFFVAMYNTVFVDGYDDFSGIHHASILSSFPLSLPLLKIPGDFFSLCTPSLALLLGTSYYHYILLLLLFLFGGVRIW